MAFAPVVLTAVLSHVSPRDVGFHRGVEYPCIKGLSMSAVDASFDLATYLADRKELVERALDESLQVEHENAQTIIESMRYSLMAGGKRIRPILCLAAAELFGGSSAVDAAMPTAVALEMIHTMSLIHDDLPAMDNDDLRRGKPTNHVLYGEAMAILAGDALLSTSFEHVAKHTEGVPAERVVDVLRRLGTCVGAIGLAGGQAMDIKCEADPNVSVDDLTWIHTHKTAALLQAAAATGAVVGGASAEDVANMEEYALKIGLAFQVADDILDVTATSEELGKTAGKDLEADKTTYPKLLGMDKSKEVLRSRHRFQSLAARTNDRCCARVPPGGGGADQRCQARTRVLRREGHGARRHRRLHHRQEELRALPRSEDELISSPCHMESIT